MSHCFNTYRSALATTGLALGIIVGSTAGAADYPFSFNAEYRDARGTAELPLPSTLGGKAPGIFDSGTLTQLGTAVPGGGPATIRIPPNTITDPANFEGFLIPLPTFIQVTTSIFHAGPTITTTLMAGGGPGTFAFCPGAPANPSCTTVSAGGTQGTVNGIIRYASGPNRFGGTLKMLVGGTAQLIVKAGPLPPTTMTTMGGTREALPFSASIVPIGATSLVTAGIGYGNTQSVPFQASPMTHPLGYMETPKGLITRGYPVGDGEAAVLTGTGFPFTTGAVYGYKKIGSQAAQFGAPHKVTVTGYDKRTAGGNGRIYLVAGGLSRISPIDGSDPPEGSTVLHARLWLTLVRQPTLSLSYPPALLTLASLLLLSAGGIAARRR